MQRSKMTPFVLSKNSDKAVSINVTSLMRQMEKIMSCFSRILVSFFMLFGSNITYSSDSDSNSDIDCLMCDKCQNEIMESIVKVNEKYQIKNQIKTLKTYKGLISQEELDQLAIIAPRLKRSPNNITEVENPNVRDMFLREYFHPFKKRMEKLLGRKATKVHHANIFDFELIYNTKKLKIDSFDHFDRFPNMIGILGVGAARWTENRNFFVLWVENNINKDDRVYHKNKSYVGFDIKTGKLKILIKDFHDDKFINLIEAVQRKLPNDCKYFVNQSNIDNFFGVVID